MKVRDLQTDTEGRFSCTGWPEGVPVRLIIYFATNRTRKLVATSLGEIRSDRFAVFPIHDGQEVTLTVEEKVKMLIEVEGRVVGFSTEDMAKIRLTLWVGTGGRRARLQWGEEGRFEAKFYFALDKVDADDEFHLELTGPEASPTRYGPFSFFTNQKVRGLVLTR